MDHDRWRPGHPVVVDAPPARLTSLGSEQSLRAKSPSESRDHGIEKGQKPHAPVSSERQEYGLNLSRKGRLQEVSKLLIFFL
jgi:hypothetical protein